MTQRYVVTKPDDGKEGSPSYFALSWWNSLAQRTLILHHGDVFSLDEGDTCDIEALIQNGCVAPYEGETEEEVSRGGDAREGH